MKAGMIALLLLVAASAKASDMIEVAEPAAPKRELEAGVGWQWVWGEAVDETAETPSSNRMLFEVSYEGIQIDGTPGRKVVLLEVGARAGLELASGGAAVPVFSLSVKPYQRSWESAPDAFGSTASFTYSTEIDLARDLDYGVAGRIRIRPLQASIAYEDAMVQVAADLLGLSYAYFMNSAGAEQGIGGVHLGSAALGLKLFDYGTTHLADIKRVRARFKLAEFNVDVDRFKVDGDYRNVLSGRFFTEFAFGFKTSAIDFDLTARGGMRFGDNPLIDDEDEASADSFAELVLAGRF